MASGFRGHSFPFSLLFPLFEPLLDTWCGAKCWGPRRVCCQEGAQASAEPSQVGECPRQENWSGVGGQNRRLCSHELAKGKCHLPILPKGFKWGSRKLPMPRLLDLLWTPSQGLYLVHLWRESVRHHRRSFLFKCVIPLPVMENNDSRQRSED